MGHWVFAVKTELGSFQKAKARYVFDGNRSVSGVDYTETAANMAHMKSVRTLCALTAARDSARFSVRCRMGKIGSPVVIRKFGSIWGSRWSATG